MSDSEEESLRRAAIDVIDDLDNAIHNWYNDQVTARELIQRYGASGIFHQIHAERARQDMVWGEQNHDDTTWLTILTEEVGEVAQAALHDRFGGQAAGTLRQELIQTAAVIVAWLECLERKT